MYALVTYVPHKQSNKPNRNQLICGAHHRRETSKFKYFLNQNTKAMEATCVCNTKAQNFPPVLPLNRIPNEGNFPPSLSFKRRACDSKGVAAIGCVALGPSSSSSPATGMQSEEEEEEEWLRMGDLREKCKERRGMVELFECLEREAIMGDDEGREPTDYNRRAHIFDKSNKVFQALKDTTTNGS